MDNASQVLDKHFDNRVIKFPWVIMAVGGCPLGSKRKAVNYAICILSMAFNSITFMGKFRFSSCLIKAAEK